VTPNVYKILMKQIKYVPTYSQESRQTKQCVKK